MNTFNSCYGGHKYLAQVNQDFKDAQTSGIQGTPFFVLTYIVKGHTLNIDLKAHNRIPFFNKPLMPH